MSDRSDVSTAPLDTYPGATDELRRALLGQAFDRARATTSTHGTFLSLAPRAEPPQAGELAGVPFAVKDNIDVAGLPTTAGSPLLRASVPEVDAGAVAALAEAGAVVVGKTNMHELAFGITSNNAEYGPVRNPVDPSRIAGGSSGGSAAAVALGAVPLALGTDTGGSVTIPAAFCGIVGFRPTTGRYPGDGVVNLSWSRDTVGLHTRSVAEARVADRVLCRQAEADAPPLDRTAIGVLRTRFADVDAHVAQAADRALEALRGAGVRLVDVEVPEDLETGAGPGLGLVLYEAARLLPARAAALPDGAERYRSFADLVGEIASPDVRGLAEMMAERPFAPAAFEEARRARMRLRRAYAEMYEASGVHAVLAPTVPVPPPPVGADDYIDLNGREEPVFATVTRNTGPGAVAGVPMLTLPMGLPPAALPVGMCLEGRFGDDPALLALGERIADVLRAASPT